MPCSRTKKKKKRHSKNENVESLPEELGAESKTTLIPVTVKNEGPNGIAVTELFSPAVNTSEALTRNIVGRFKSAT